jgi:hypothetical protein
MNASEHDQRRDQPVLATVGQLRAALAGLPDITPLVVNAEDASDPEEAAIEQVITSVGFGLIDWGDGRGLRPDKVLALNCRANYDDLRDAPPGLDPAGPHENR